MLHQESQDLFLMFSLRLGLTGRNLVLSKWKEHTTEILRGRRSSTSMRQLLHQMLHALNRSCTSAGTTTLDNGSKLLSGKTFDVTVHCEIWHFANLLPAIMRFGCRDWCSVGNRGEYLQSDEGAADTIMLHTCDAFKSIVHSHASCDTTRSALC